VGTAEVGQVVRERPGRRDEVLVIAGAVRLEPVAVVVGLEVAQELERLRWKAAEAAYGITTGAIVTGLWTV
jgi:hypothetical protein